MLEDVSSRESDSVLSELVQFSSEALLRKTEPLISIGSDATYIGAAPLMPLRDRDVAVLNALFLQDGIAEIEADILSGLLQRHPEPCWEDDAIDLFRDLLG